MRGTTMLRWDRFYLYSPSGFHRTSNISQQQRVYGISELLSIVTIFLYLSTDQMAAMLVMSWACCHWVGRWRDQFHRVKNIICLLYSVPVRCVDEQANRREICSWPAVICNLHAKWEHNYCNNGDPALLKLQTKKGRKLAPFHIWARSRVSHVPSYV